MKKQLGFAMAHIIILIVILVGSVGWVWNIVKIVQSNFDPISGMLIARCFGVFIPPLGAVLGFL